MTKAKRQRCLSSVPRRRSTRLNPPPGTTFYDLPPELLHVILQPPPATSMVRRPSATRGYLRLRLVNRAFAAIVATYAFSDILISDDESSLDRLASIAARSDLAKYLKAYRYSFRNTYMLDRAVVSHYHSILAGAGPSRAALPESMRTAIAAFERRSKFDLSNALHYMHVNHLQTLPNLRSITVTVSHGDFTMAPQRAPICFRAMLLTLSERAKNPSVRAIEELTVDGLVESTFVGMTPEIVSQAEAGFKQLKTLKLLLGMRSRYDRAHEVTPGWVKLTGRLLRAAKNVEKMSLGNIHGYCPGTHPGLIEWSMIVGCGHKNLHVWKKLAELHLKNVLFSRELVARYFKAQKKASPLNHLCVTRCDLKEETELLPVDAGAEQPRDYYTWPSALRELKPTLSGLGCLVFRELSDGKGGYRHMHKLEADAWADWIMAKMVETITYIPVPATPSKPTTKARSKRKKKVESGVVELKQVVEVHEAQEPTPGKWGPGYWCEVHRCQYPEEFGYDSWSEDSEEEEDSEMWSTDGEDEDIAGMGLGIGYFGGGGGNGVYPYEGEFSTEDESLP